MKKLFFVALLPLMLPLVFIFIHPTPTCAYSIDTCAGIGGDGNFYDQSSTICYYSITESPFYTSDADHACKHPGCPSLPTISCQDMVRQDPNRSHNEFSVSVDTTIPGGSACGNFLTGGAPYKCCAKSITPLPTIIPITPANPCPNGTCATAIGDIKTDPSSLVASIFQVILGLSGGIAVILIMVSGYNLAFSQGNPEKVQSAREQLTAAVVGLLFIIFSVSILRIVGVDVLKIPGFR